MLQSLKLRTDKLVDATNNSVDSHNTNNLTSTTPTTNPLLTTLITPTTPTSIANNSQQTTTHFVRETLSTPVASAAAVHANGLGVYKNNNCGNNNNCTHIVNNNNNNSNHLNNIHHLQQYQAKYLESAIASEVAATNAAAAINVTTSKTFHPYLRPLPKTSLSSSLSSSSNATTLSSTKSTLFQTILQTQINSTVVGTSPPTTKTTSGVTTAANTLAATASSGLLTLPTTPTPTSLANNMENQSSQINPTNSKPMDVESSSETMEISTNDCMALVPSSNAIAIRNKIDDEFSKEEPDHDTIKMFVGQVPKSWDEIKLRNLFEQYGRVHTLNVLRDKVTMLSRGCCFVTYYTRRAALKAQDALHNIRTLDGMHHPIQMKPADSENRNERKLFVGMLNKKYNEADVRQLFAGHGTIEECTVLRDQNGQSKACAFVTFDTKQHAISAIKSLHHSQTMEGCSAPLVVKFADTQKEKDQKKIQQFSVGLCGITALTTPQTAHTAVIGGLAVPPSVSNALNPTNALVPTPVAATTRRNPTMAALHAAIAAPPPPTLPTATGATAGMIPTSAASLSAVQPTMFVSAASAAPQPSSPYFTTTSDAMIPSSAAAAAAAQNFQIFQQFQAYGLQPAHYLQGLNFPPDHSTTAASLSAPTATGNTTASGNGLLATPISMQNLVTLASLNPGNPQQQLLSHGATTQQHLSVPTSQALTYNAAQVHQAHMAQLTAAHHMSMAAATPPSYAAHFAGSTGHHHALWTGAEALTSPYAPALNTLTNGAYATASAPLTASALQAAAAGVAGKQIEGPEGSNLFIYHLPQEFTDTDLASTFLPFGNVFSAKVFIDKQTNLSKCFGFVSYDNPHSATAAIQAMHGFQIGTKRLKVQLKRSKDAAKPY